MSITNHNTTHISFRTSIPINHQNSFGWALPAHPRSHATGRGDGQSTWTGEDIHRPHPTALPTCQPSAAPGAGEDGGGGGRWSVRDMPVPFGACDGGRGLRGEGARGSMGTGKWRSPPPSAGEGPRTRRGLWGGGGGGSLPPEDNATHARATRMRGIPPIGPRAALCRWEGGRSQVPLVEREGVRGTGSGGGGGATRRRPQDCRACPWRAAVSTMEGCTTHCTAFGGTAGPRHSALTTHKPLQTGHGQCTRATRVLRTRRTHSAPLRSGA